MAAPLGRRMVKGFRIEDLHIKSFKLTRVKIEERAKAIALRSLWAHGDSREELLSINLFECASVKAAHDQLLEMLADVQSPKWNGKRERCSRRRCFRQANT